MGRTAPVAASKGTAALVRSRARVHWEWVHRVVRHANAAGKERSRSPSTDTLSRSCRFSRSMDLLVELWTCSWTGCSTFLNGPFFSYVT